MNARSEFKPRFDFSVATRLQRVIAERFREGRLHSNPRVLVGLDLSYTRSGEQGFAVAVALDFETLRPVETGFVKARVEVPYRPGYLAFREAPLAYAALQRLEAKGVEPDVIVVDGHGRAHPRKAGIATHIGVALDKPSIGVAKKKLAGVECTHPVLGSTLCIGGEYVAVIIEHRGSRLYVSVGHKLTLEDAARIIRRTLHPMFKLPLPTQYADSASKRARSLAECLEGRLEACEEKLLEHLETVYSLTKQRTLF